MMTLLNAKKLATIDEFGNLDKGRFTILLFGTEQYGRCKQQKEIIESSARGALPADIPMDFYYIDVADQGELCEQIGVKAVPLVVFAYWQGRVGLPFAIYSPEDLRENIMEFEAEGAEARKLELALEPHVRHCTTEEEYNNLVAASDLVIVDFWATWCGPCAGQAEIFGRGRDQLAAVDEKFIIVKINVDEATNLAVKYNADSIPLLQIYVRGELRATKVGRTEVEELLELIRGKTPARSVKSPNHARPANPAGKKGGARKG